MGLFKKTKPYSMTISRSIGDMEQIQVLMTADDINEFPGLLKVAEGAIQWRADQFQTQLRNAEAEVQKAREAAVAKGRK